MICFDSSEPLLTKNTQLKDWDDFLTGSTGSGSIGRLGWLSSGTITYPASETNTPGILKIDTGGSSGTHARINFANGSAFDPSENHLIRWRSRLNTNDANTTVRIGSANSVAGAPPSHGIYFEKLDNDTNWFVVTRASSSQTRTDSGIAIDTNFHIFTYIKLPTEVRFYIDGNLITTHTATLPTTFLSPFVYIINSAAASKTLDNDKFDIVVTGLGR